MAADTRANKGENKDCKYCNNTFIVYYTVYYTAARLLDAVVNKRTLCFGLEHSGAHASSRHASTTQQACSFTVNAATTRYEVYNAENIIYLYMTLTSLLQCSLTLSCFGVGCWRVLSEF